MSVCSRDVDDHEIDLRYVKADLNETYFADLPQELKFEIAAHTINCGDTSQCDRDPDMCGDQGVWMEAGRRAGFTKEEQLPVIDGIQRETFTRRDYEALCDVKQPEASRGRDRKSRAFFLERDVLLQPITNLNLKQLVKFFFTF